MKNLIVILAMVAVAGWASTAFAVGHTDTGCSNCHVPHWAGDPADPTVYGVPLWNPAVTGTGLPTYDLYDSPGFTAAGGKATIVQPQGPSKLCLGCHDGSATGGVTDPTKIFGVADLKRTHPISFVYDKAMADTVGISLYDPTSKTSGLGGTIDADLLDEKHMVQCTSCHDVHKTGQGDDHLRYVDQNTLCKTCHNR